MSIENSRWKAVLFDMDGVVLDSMDMHYRLWKNIFADYGVRLTKMDVFLREGEKAEKSIREIFRLRGQALRSGQLEEMFRKKRALLKGRAGVRVFPGVLPLLGRLRRVGIPLGLVTGTRRGFLRRVLPQKVKKCFDVVVTSDDVRHGKPNPESYRLAVRRLGIPMRDTLIVENSPFGVLAANRAGGYCIALATTLGPRYLRGADRVVRSHASLYKLLTKFLPSNRASHRR